VQCWWLWEWLYLRSCLRHGQCASVRLS